MLAEQRRRRAEAEAAGISQEDQNEMLIAEAKALTEKILDRMGPEARAELESTSLGCRIAAVEVRLCLM